MATKEQQQAKKIEELRDQHKWLACLALKKAFSNDFGQNRQLDWTALAEAAFHAGAATVLYDLTF